jgi:light-regulated signal transduction histidine kinase (bacteriophytochrome)
MDEIKSDLDLAIEQRGAVIDHEPLPTVIAVPNQMHQLFFNLITNALKFSKPHVAPQITVSSQRVTDAVFPEEIKLDANQKYVQINVGDNGIGFRQEYAVQIFSLFKRLHRRSEYEGTGIGLALCKKIAENHRGHIWAESQPDEGTIFKILLPVE